MQIKLDSITQASIIPNEMRRAEIVLSSQNFGGLYAHLRKCTITGKMAKAWTRMRPAISR